MRSPPSPSFVRTHRPRVWWSRRGRAHTAARAAARLQRVGDAYSVHVPDLGVQYMYQIQH
eukprot:3974216-Prymnesium_polylepis.1